MRRRLGFFALRHTCYGYVGGILFLFLGVSSVGISDRRVTTNKGNVSSPKNDERVALPPNLKVPIEWQKLLDPTQDEFWNEGNFKPDQGFLIWAKNPTIENAKLYLIRMNAKRNTVNIMQKQQEAANKELISQGIIANDYDFLTSQTGKIVQSSSDAELKDTQIFLMFHPTCPHCKRQAQILKGMKNVTPMQVAGDLVELEGLPPSIFADKEDIKKYAPDMTVPVLLIYSSKSNAMTVLKGVHTIEEIKEVAHALQNKRG